MTLEFIFAIVDPFINSCWGLHAIDFNEDYEPYTYFVPGIIGRQIEFLVSPESVANLGYMKIEWPSNSRYTAKMKKRIKAAEAKA